MTNLEAKQIENLDEFSAEFYTRLNTTDAMKADLSDLAYVLDLIADNLPDRLQRSFADMKYTLLYAHKVAVEYGVPGSNKEKLFRELLSRLLR